MPRGRAWAYPTVWVPLIALAALVVLTIEVYQTNGIVNVDLHVRSWTDQHQVGPLHDLATVLTYVLSPEVDVIAFLVYGWRSARVEFRSALKVVGVAAVGVLVLKAVVSRQPAAPHAHFHFYGSFPSGHTAAILICGGSALILTELDRAVRRRLWLVLIVAATLVASALVYIGAHWPSDILGAVALAVIVLWGVAQDQRSVMSASGGAAEG